MTTYQLCFDAAARNYSAKDGALLALGHLGPLIKRKPQYRANLEDLLQARAPAGRPVPVGRSDAAARAADESYSIHRPVLNLRVANV